jgi:hypothetical protein
VEVFIQVHTFNQVAVSHHTVWTEIPREVSEAHSLALCSRLVQRSFDLVGSKPSSLRIIEHVY